MCTAFALGSATKTRSLESVVRADGDCNASMRNSGSLGPAMMSSVRSRIGCNGPLTSSAEENARTKLRLGEGCCTPAGWEALADAAFWAVAGLGPVQQSRMQPAATRHSGSTERLGWIDWPADTTTHPCFDSIGNAERVHCPASQRYVSAVTKVRTPEVEQKE